ncbi:hypothetical protein Pfo_024611 [Paulownia fortunei]|nr:hypothetical protein Pfo_024611 [Paulownia fortunei]
MGALQTFEMNLNQNKREKNKGIALQVEAENEQDHGDDDDPLALLTKNFRKAIQCRECEGFGHIQAECANTLNKMSKSLTPLEQEEHVSNHIALTSITLKKKKQIETLDVAKDVVRNVATSHRYELIISPLEVCLNSISLAGTDSDENSDHEGPSFEDIQCKYEEMFENWLKVCKTNEGLAKQVAILTKENEALKGDVIRLELLAYSRTHELDRVKKELENTMKSVRNLNSGTSQLDEIICIGQYSGNRVGLGYSGGESSSKGAELQNSGKISKTIFVKEIRKSESMFESAKKIWLKRQRSKSNRFVSTCHFYQIPGHIRPNYFKYNKALLNGMSIFSGVLQHPAKNTPKIKIDLKNDTKHRIWIRKIILPCHVAHTSLKANIIESWYFNSGYSRHMTGDKENLRDYQNQEGGQVTFGDGVRARIIRKGTLNVDGLPTLRNMLHVEGLKSNLISINLCQVFDDSNICILTCRRSSDNCYKLQHKLNSCKIARIRSDHGKEFENSIFSNYCDKHGIFHGFSTPKTPQQNGVKLTRRLWAEALNTACYTINHVHLRPGTKVTSYEIWKDKKPNLKQIISLCEETKIDQEEKVKTDVGIPDVTTSKTTSEDVAPDAATSSESEEETKSFDTFEKVRKEPSSRIQKNHPADQVIGGIYVSGTADFGIWYSNDTNADLVGYSDADWAGDVENRKSLIGGCFYLGNNLISWYSKKQNYVSLCCSQFLWMKQMLEDYRIKESSLIVYCDNSSAINISKNRVQHSRTKHIDIQHHFIRDLIERKVVTIDYVTTEN